MKKNVLIVAFHFPPMGGSSGGLRSLKFVKYLRDHDWHPTVLTVNPRVYDRLDNSGLPEIPDETKIIRAFALDARKHLSIRSRYPGFLAIPDRWSSWLLGAVPAGLSAIRRYNIDVIFSTYPVASAALVGMTLQRLSGRPWIADFRDPMIEEGYPSDPGVYRAHAWIEKRAIRNARRVVYTTQSTREDQIRRYPDLAGERSLVISNGYDEQDFARIVRHSSDEPVARVRLVHGGIIYPEDRNPEPLFAAVRRLFDEDRIPRDSLVIELRGSKLDSTYQQRLDEKGIADVVKLLPGIPYNEFLQDASRAEGLLILQGKSCDRQIPAKVYEYLRLGKPLLALTSDSGESAALLRSTGGATIVDIDDEIAIASAICEFHAAVIAGTHPGPDAKVVSQYSRAAQAGRLAECLDDLLEAT